MTWIQINIQNYFAIKPKKIQESKSEEPNLEIYTDISTVENRISTTINIGIEQAGTSNFEQQTTEWYRKIQYF